QENPFDARSETDARRGWTAHQLGETVVPSAAANGVLRAVECLGGELEDRARVVVEATDEPGCDLVVDMECFEAVLDALEVLARLGGEVVTDRRRAGNRVVVLRALRIENAQWVQSKRFPRLFRQ